MKLSRKNFALTPETPQEAAILFWLAKYFEDNAVWISLDTVCSSSDFREDREMNMTLKFAKMSENFGPEEKPRCLGTIVEDPS